MSYALGPRRIRIRWRQRNYFELTGPFPPPMDITEYVESIDGCTDVGNGTMPTATIMLDGREGWFVTSTNGNAVPILQQYDNIQVEIEDEERGLFEKHMLVDDIQPYTNSTGTHVTLSLVGRERFLQKSYITGYYPFMSIRDMLGVITTYYNAARGSEQPALAIPQSDRNALPGHMYGTFDFGDETTIYDAIQEVVRRIGLPVGAAGAGEKYSAVVDEDSSLGNIIMRIIPRGRHPQHSDMPLVSKTLNITRTRSPEEGNIVVVHGQPGTGSYPKAVAEMRGLIEEYLNIPAWNPAVPYSKAAFVRHRNRVYQSRGASAGQEPGARSGRTSWFSRTLQEYTRQYQAGWPAGFNTQGVTPFQYSPWTSSKKGPIKNWGGNPEATSSSANFDRLCFPDSNLVIRETSTQQPAHDNPWIPQADVLTIWRDWVDFRITNSRPLAYYTAENRYGQPYDGMRILYDGSISNTAAIPGLVGNDEFGNAYENAMCQYVKGKWVVFRTPRQFDTCAVLHEGRCYGWEQALSNSWFGAPYTNRVLERLAGDTDGRLAWRDISGSIMANDCFHYPTSMSNIAGMIWSDQNDRLIIQAALLEDSAIRLTYRHIVNDPVATSLIDKFVPGVAPAKYFIRTIVNAVTTLITPITLTDDEKARMHGIDSYNDGWWTVLFEAPYPKSVLNGITESVGGLYKDGVFDLYNLNDTPSGAIGYAAADADQMGELDGIGFYFRFNIDGATIRELLGDIPFRCVMYDIFGGVWKYDFVIRFQNETQFIRLPFASFTAYRSRLPIAFDLVNWVQRAKNPELRETEIYQRFFMKRIVLHCMWSYDDQGRYDPFQLGNMLHKVGGLVSDTTINFTGDYDAVHFTKTPVAIARAGSISDRHTMAPIKKYPHVSNYIQLQKIANAELDIAQHQEDIVEFELDNKTPVTACGLQAEQSIFIHDSRTIAEAEAGDGSGGSIPNTREYIVDKITYSVGDRRTSSGLKAVVRCSRRIAT